MDSRPDRQKSRTKVTLIIVSTVGLAGIFVLLVCGGLAFWLYRGLSSEVPAAKASAEAFLDELKADRIGDAYSRTSSGLQSNLTAEQFRRFVGTFPILKEQTSSSLQLNHFYQGTGGGRVSFRANLQSSAGMGTCTLTLVKERSEWKVQEIRVP